MARTVPLLPSSLRWLLVGLVVAVIVAVSVVPTGGAGQTVGPLGIGVDKYLHALGYAGLALVIAYAMAESGPRRAALVALAAAVLCGIAVEVVQLPLPYRRFSGRDMLANATGATLAASLWGAIAGRITFRAVPVPLGGDERRREP